MDKEILSMIGGALVAGKVVEKILGPTAEYLGQGLKTFAEKRVQNVQNIFRFGALALGSQIDEPGVVPPRVLAGILNEGSYCDDPLAAEYLGGVLASSRSTITRDDRGAALISLVTRLSSYQLRLHYIIYATIVKVHRGSGLTVGTGTDRFQLFVFIPESVLNPAFDFSPKEAPEPIMHHALSGLNREALIFPNFWLRQTRLSPEVGLTVGPWMAGAELFLAAHGFRSVSGNDLVRTDLSFEPVQLLRMDLSRFLTT
jgi:hypothetical protein